MMLLGVEKTFVMISEQVGVGGEASFVTTAHDHAFTCIDIIETLVYQ